MVSLQLHGLGASYGGRQVLSGIGTPPLLGGQLVALLGPNAAGKSTLFRRIFGLLRGPGEVRVHGATVSRPIAYMFSPGIWWIGSKLNRSGSDVQHLQICP